MPLTNPPFMQQPGQPPLHFRKLTPEEFAQWTRMRDTAERCADKLFGPMPRDPKSEKNLCERTPAEMEQMNRTVSSIREELYQLDAELQRLETL